MSSLKLAITSSDRIDDKPAIPTEVHQAFLDCGFDVDDYGLVSWLEDSPSYPRNWKFSKRCLDSAFIIVFEFIATLFTNVGVPAANHSQGELDISQELAIFAFSTIHHLGQALGTIVLTPFTDTFGRRRSYIIACVIYAAGCILVVAPQHIAGVFFGRLISGVASAVPATVAAESLEELWDFKQRIWAYYLWISGAVLGLAIGPVVATFLTTSILGGWRSMFWIAAMCTGSLAVLSMFMYESRATSILEAKIREISSTFGSQSTISLHCIDQNQTPLKTYLLEDLTRPIKLLISEPIIVTVSVLNSTLYATIYLLGEAIQVVYTSFGFSERQCSLVNLAMGFGLILSMCTRLFDNKLATDRVRRQRFLIPEDKLFGFYVAAPCLAIAAWWFAWSIPPAVSPTSVSPWVSIFALVFVGFACNEFDYVLSGYLTEVYASHASSANASLEFFRAILCGCYPLWGTQMFQNLGNNAAASTLAAIATGYCIVALLFWKYGKRLREASKVAD